MRYIRFTVLMAVLSMFAGCIGDPADPALPEKKKENSFTLDLRVPGMTEVGTRATAAENFIRDIGVYVFDENDLYVTEITGTIINPPSHPSDGRPYTQAYFPASSLPSGLSNFSFVVLANRDVSAFQGTLQITTGTGVTKSTFLDQLRYRQNIVGDSPAVWGNCNSLNFQPLIMVGITDRMASIPTPDTAVKVNLVRSVARVDIVSDKSEFLPSWLYVRNFNSIGVVAGYENLIPPFNFTYVDREMPSLPPNNTAIGEGKLFIFEQPAVDDTDMASYVTSPHFIIRATYQGEEYYYRINIVSDGSVPGYAKGEYMPILRNHKYTVRIKNIYGPGAETFDEASADRGGLNNIDYEVHVVDDGASTIVVSDGRHSLRLDKDEVEISHLSGASGSINVFADVDGIMAPSCKATIPAGSWLKFNSLPYNQPQEIAITPSINNNIEFYAEGLNDTSTPRSAVITVTAGNLSRNVTVTQLPNTASLSIETTAVADINNSDPNRIVFYTWQNKEFIDGSPTRAQIYFEWSSRDGRMVVAPSGQTPPFHYSSADGCFDFTTLAPNQYWTDSPRLVTVAPQLASETQPNSQESNARSIVDLQIMPPTPIYSHVEIQQHNYYFVYTPASANPFVFDSTYRDLDFKMNIADAHIELADEAPQWLLDRIESNPVQYSFILQGYDFDAMSILSGQYNYPLTAYGTTTTYHVFCLPTITQGEWASICAAEGYNPAEPFKMKFRISAKPCNAYPDVEVEDFFTIDVVPMPQLPPTYSFDYSDIAIVWDDLSERLAATISTIDTRPITWEVRPLSGDTGDFTGRVSGNNLYFRANSVNNSPTTNRVAQYSIVPLIDGVECQPDGAKPFKVVQGVKPGEEITIGNVIWAPANLVSTIPLSSNQFSTSSKFAESASEVGSYYVWGQSNAYPREYQGQMVMPASVNLNWTPCPAGWRLPTEQEYDDLVSNTYHIDSYFEGVKGCTFILNNGSSIFFPYTGRNYYTPYYYGAGYGEMGAYWSSTVASQAAPSVEVLYFSGTDGYYKLVETNAMNFYHDYPNSFGIPIRCVKSN